jgi:phosphate transport system substrate-binding protein
VAAWWIASTWQHNDIDSAGAADPACSFALAGSNTIGERLAPAVVAAYFRSRGYDVAEPDVLAQDEVRVTAVRAGERCVIDIRSHGSSYAFRELAADSAVIGMASRAIGESEIEALRSARAGDFASEAALAEHVIGLDGIAVVVHPSNPLTTISRTEVRDLFLRRYTNWRDVGGPTAAVDLYARDDDSGTFQFFLEHVLEDDARWEAASVEARRFASSSELVAGVANNAGGIGFVGVAYVNDTVRVLSVSDGGPAFAPSAGNVRAESYPISRRLFLYVRPQTIRDDEVIAGLVAFFKSPEAYESVERLGYVSLREVRREAAPDGTTSAAGAECMAGTPETAAYVVATSGADRLSSVIRFLPGSNTADSLARDDVVRAAGPIREALDSRRTVTLVGHSDAAGDEDVNRRLALQRAETIREAFEAQGLFGLQVESAGERCPVASNDTPQGRQSNRRVEIWIHRG